MRMLAVNISQKIETVKMTRLKQTIGTVNKERLTPE
jgi:hypothetical protein